MGAGAGKVSEEMRWHLNKAFENRKISYKKILDQFFRQRKLTNSKTTTRTLENNRKKISA